jgi:sec-independent protein translocase protein TatC
VKEAPLLEHLEELRRRILWSALIWLLMAAVAWEVRIRLLDLLERPLQAYALAHKLALDQLLVFHNLLDPLITSLKIAGFGGLLLALPFTGYQLWAFIAPGLYPHERRMAIPFLLGAGFSFTLGALFAYYVVLPVAVPILVSFLGNAARPLLSIGNYVGWVLTFMAGMGVLFEMPVVSYLLAALGLLSSQFLIRNWRVAVLLLVILAAVITPTADVVSLTLVSLPLLALFALSIGVTWLVERRRKQRIPA